MPAENSTYISGSVDMILIGEFEFDVRYSGTRLNLPIGIKQGDAPLRTVPDFVLHEVMLPALHAWT